MWVFKPCVWDLRHSVTHFCSLLSLTLSPPAALLVTLVGIVASAPISDKLDVMKKDTIEQAHSLINKIIQDIPTTHAAWINSKVSVFQDCNHHRRWGTFPPLYSEEQSISMGFSVTDSYNCTCGPSNLQYLVKCLQFNLFRCIFTYVHWLVVMIVK